MIDARPHTHHEVHTLLLVGAGVQQTLTIGLSACDYTCEGGPAVWCARQLVLHGAVAGPVATHRAHLSARAVLRAARGRLRRKAHRVPARPVHRRTVEGAGGSLARVTHAVAAGEFPPHPRARSMTARASVFVQAKRRERMTPTCHAPQNLNSKTDPSRVKKTTDPHS